MSTSTPAPQTAQKFGTFLGVFTPSVLTILGLIMYLRFGWVVGNVGLGYTLLMVLMASSVTFITALSASAVATNMRVGVGGEYYLVSHSLGLELGGAIGIPLFLCRTLSITFYSFGLAESLLILWPAEWGAIPSYAVPVGAAVIIILITAVAGKSAAMALKLQIPIMIAVGLSLLALAAGVFSAPLQAPQWQAYAAEPQNFWYVFAVFFPAVTGFTAGIGMSGDLKNPQQSIPRGTLLAVVTGTTIYLIIPVLLAISTRLDPALLNEVGAGVWIQLAMFGPLLIFPGIWGAILSSAFGSALGGPRVLQALASDGLAPRFLAKVSKTGQPTVATWISGAIALSAVALGGLNTVAQFVTVLFLTLYVTINLSAALEQLVGDPSYRPTIHVPWYVALLGSLGAIVMMFLISPLGCVLGVILEVLLYLYLRRMSLQKQWGDVRAGLWVALARFSLLKLRQQGTDPRNWRPHILLFLGDPKKRLALVRLASRFHHNRGVVTACQLSIGDLHSTAVADIDAQTQEMDNVFDEDGLTVFSEVNVVSEFERGAIDVTQANGFAGLHSNTVMFGWSEKPHRQEAQLRIMRSVARAGKSTVIVRLNWAHEPGQRKRMDLWWGGLQNNGDMMLLLAHMLHQDADWHEARLVVHSIVANEEEKQSMAENLAQLIPETRIRAETEIIIRQPGERVPDIIHRESGAADVVFLGLSEPELDQEAEYAGRLGELASGLRTTIFVRNAGKFAGSLI